METRRRSDEPLDRRESWDEEDEPFLEDDGDPGPPGRLLVLTSSYGVSALIHVGFILIAAFIVWSTKAPAEPTLKLLPKLARKERPYDHKPKRDIHPRPEVEHKDKVKHPIKPLDAEKEPTTDVPKGISFDNQSDKNLDAAQTNDAIGTLGGAAGPYGSRFGNGAPRIGGGEHSESAVLAALWWLKRHQRPDGSCWSADGFDQQCGEGPEGEAAPPCSGHDLRARTGKGPGAGDPEFDVGVTALSLLAFLGNGHSHRHARVKAFKGVVRRGLHFLQTAQREDGSIGFGGGEDIYNHVIATMALCDAVVTSGDFRLKRPAQRAVDWMVRAQNPGLGWKYGVQSGKNDTSVTGWAVLALKAAHTAKLQVPQAAFDGALAWLERATSEGGRGKPPGLVGYERAGDGGSMVNRKAFEREAGYRPLLHTAFQGAPTMTAVAVLCRVFTGQPRKHERVRQGLKVMMARMPRWDGPGVGKDNETNFYYWYYGTYGVFQATRKDSPEWAKWNVAMREAILGDGTNRQRMGGCEDGSWDPIDEWGIPGGRVYATATNALTLEIYYRYERMSGDDM